MWAALAEKAWAKIKGSYDISDGGFVQTGLRSLTGVPVFSYKAVDINDTITANAAWQKMKDADLAGYYIGTGTAGSGND